MAEAPRRKITIVSPCFNVEENVEELAARVGKAVSSIPELDYEHLFIDNASTDGTAAKIKAIAATNRRVKLIVNNRKFGANRSSFHGLRQARGDMVVLLGSDLQEPPELLPEMVRQWQQGFQVVYCVKEGAEGPPLMFALRKLYYWLLSKVSDVEVVRNFTGFGLFDQRVIQELRKVEDPNPYFRGLLAEFGFRSTRVMYRQPPRRRGFTGSGFYPLYDTAMLGITSYSKAPIRLAALSGFLLSILSFLLAAGFLISKLVFWSRFPVGISPMLIGIFFFSAVQLFFIGMVGEYIGLIHTRVMRRPLVLERERVNFDS